MQAESQFGIAGCPGGRRRDAVRFYRDPIGIDRVERPDFGFPGAMFEVGPLVPATTSNRVNLSRGDSVDDLDAVYQQLIDGPITVTLATQASDRLQLNAMWFEASPDRSCVHIDTVMGRAKDRQVRSTGHAAINAINPENPHHWVTIYCDVDDVIDETDTDRGHLATESIDRLAKLYLDADVHPLRVEGEQRALFVLRPTKTVTFGAP